MLDREGYRPNVGIILLNQRNEVWWGKRIHEDSWQFPQGGIKHDETPVEAVIRELQEETGLRAEHDKIIGRTRHWLRYDVPEQFIRREIRGQYKGQKQIWFLLKMIGSDADINLNESKAPEFDDWCWHPYWIPIESVIDFKQAVYVKALKELSRFITPRPVIDNPNYAVIEAKQIKKPGKRHLSRKYFTKKKNARKKNYVKKNNG